MIKRFLLILFLTGLSVVNIFATGPASATVSPDKLRTEALAVFDELDRSGNYTEVLTLLEKTTEPLELPMGLSRTTGNTTYSIAVSNIRLMDGYAELTVWGRVKIQQNSSTDRQQKTLFFGAQGIKLSYDGNIIGDAFLTLLGDFPMKINGGSADLILKGRMDLNSGIGDILTYMAIDCKGFKSLGVTADIIFSDSFITKVGEDGTPVVGDKRVMTSFSAQVDDWSDILVDISLPSFEMKGLDGFVFNVKHTVFDFSDKRNAESIAFPEGYEQYLISGNPNLWRGVYIADLGILLPKHFTHRRDTTKRIGFAAQNMLFDNNGVSGVFRAENILSLDDGSAGGWPFSITDFSIELMANQLAGAGFGGEIKLPVAETSPLKYDAFISPGNEYRMTVKTVKDIDFDIWSAHVKLFPNSYLKLEVKDGNFRPEAMLDGVMSINTVAAAAVAEGVGAQLNNITFQRLNLKTVSPYFMVDYLGWDGESKMGNFPVTIGHIALKTTAQEARLGFDISVKVGAAPFDMAAGTRLEVVGSMNRERGLQTWKYKRLDVSEISLDATIAEVFSLKGKLKWMRLFLLNLYKISHNIKTL